MIACLGLSQLTLAQDNKFEISLNQKVWQLDHALILRHQQLYIALPDLAKGLGATSSFIKKDLAYRLTLPNVSITCLFLQHGREWWLLDKRHFFKRALFLEKDQLYVPLKALSKALGYDYQKEGTTIKLKSNLAKSNVLAKSRLSMTHPMRSIKGSYTRPLLDQGSTLPILSRKKDNFITFQEKAFPLKHFFYKNGVLYVYLTPSFEKLGFKVTHTKQSYRIERGGQVYSFSKKSHWIHVGSAQKKQKLRLAGIAAVLKRGKRHYVPLENIISAFDYAAYWDKAERKIVLQAKLQGFYWEKQGIFPVLKLLTSQPIYCSEPYKGWLKEGYYFTLPNTAAALPKAFKKSPHPFLKWTKVSQKGADTQVFLRSGPGSVQPTILLTVWGAELRFHSILLSAKERLHGQNLQFKIKGTKAFKVKSQYLKKQDKLVLDFPNTYSELPLLLRSKYGVYKRVRMSQYQLEPPISRMVFDFPKGSKPKWHIKHRDGQLTLSFSLSKSKVTQVKKQYKKRKIKKLKSGLAHKVIIVDAGHGGRDPGAIGLGREYEKRYTLDVAKRLQRLLEAKGAYVIMTRRSDRSASLPRRVRVANRKRADLYVSLHFNSYAKSKAHGTETYYYKSKDRRLAKTVHRQMVKHLGLKDNGIRRSRLYVLRHSRMPAVLLEPAYMTDKKNLRKIKSPVFRQTLAKSVAKGLEIYFK